ncbi:glycosyltransferase family 4 protein [Methylobacillus caricis]|uniref:glycosyltransferase family 4 protein n=1 Tax=Methylobacillus caricis TaxID=1971611 RepID=UPI001D001691|nr:glycosyltransferase family 4 protein [Methylobacillus caricis]MCB5188077.1 glycosyltransferase family 4 protein [Methylobacillus caricis]
MLKKISVYYSIPEYFPPFRVDLSELVAKSLSQRGVDTVWYMGTDEDGLKLRDKTFFEQHCSIPPKLAGNNFFTKLLNKLLYWVVDVILIAKSVFSKYDIIQVRDKYIAAFIGLLVAKIVKKPFIYWCSYPYPEHSIEMAKKSKGIKKFASIMQGYLAVFLLYKCVIRFADHTFVQSEQMLRDIVDYGVDKNKLTPVPMGVPERLLTWVESNATRKSPKTVVYLGTLASIRQLDTIIEAFSLVLLKHSDAKLIMVGDGNKPEERFALEKLASKLNILHAIEFTGFVPIERAWGIAAAAEVCLSPFFPTKTLASASPTKLVEYLALGRPVVCNNHPEQSDVITASGAGICVDWSAKAFADAIVSMLDEPEKTEEMAAKGPLWVKQNRTYNRIADKVFMRYQILLEIA